MLSTIEDVSTVYHPHSICPASIKVPVCITGSNIDFQSWGCALIGDWWAPNVLLQPQMRWVDRCLMFGKGQCASCPCVIQTDRTMIILITRWLKTPISPGLFWKYCNTSVTACVRLDNTHSDWAVGEIPIIQEMVDHWPPCGIEVGLVVGRDDDAVHIKDAQMRDGPELLFEILEGL